MIWLRNDVMILGINYSCAAFVVYDVTRNFLPRKLGTQMAICISSMNQRDIWWLKFLLIWINLQASLILLIKLIPLCNIFYINSKQSQINVKLFNIFNQKQSDMLMPNTMYHVVYVVVKN